MKYAFYVHRNSVEILKKIGFRFIWTDMAICEKSGVVRLFAQWTADDEHVYETNRAVPCNCSISGGTYTATEFGFECISDVFITAKLMSDDESINLEYDYSHCIVHKREIEVFFTPENYRSFFKDVLTKNFRDHPETAPIEYELDPDGL